jgi:hypothetical protein
MRNKNDGAGEMFWHVTATTTTTTTKSIILNNKKKAASRNQAAGCSLCTQPYIIVAILFTE